MVIARDKAAWRRAARRWRREAADAGRTGAAGTPGLPVEQPGGAADAGARFPETAAGWESHPLGKALLGWCDGSGRGAAGARPVVAAYASYGTEPPTWGLIEFLMAHGIDVLLPAPGTDGAIAWGLAEPGDLPVAPEHTGRPWEPGGARLGAAALAHALAIVVPALAADLGGTRLGQGGGWYDRALLHAAPGVPVVALLYPAELLPAGTLPREAHDLPLTHAATPTALVSFASPPR